MSETELIKNTTVFVKNKLANAEAGHDWFHIQRVYQLALYIAQKEGINNLLIIKLGALLHDIADAKFHDGNEDLGPQMAGEFLETQAVNNAVINEVKLIIKHISFKTEAASYTSDHLKILQDADRLDAMGAIGIARAFNYGGFKNRALYNPEIPSKPQQSKAEYKASKAPTLNHFDEKLLLLKDQMHTKTAKRIAQERHDYMLNFVERFKQEWHLEIDKV
ncbi:MAG: HD domain-containing protein [Psychroflexus salarius]